MLFPQLEPLLRGDFRRNTLKGHQASRLKSFRPGRPGRTKTIWRFGRRMTRLRNLSLGHNMRLFRRLKAQYYSSNSGETGGANMPLFHRKRTYQRLILTNILRTIYYTHINGKKGSHSSNT